MSARETVPLQSEAQLSRAQDDTLDRIRSHNGLQESEPLPREKQPPQSSAVASESARGEIVSGSNSREKVILNAKQRIFAAASLIVLAILLVYCNSLSGSLVFDDALAITDNPSIRRLWPLGPVFAPPAECTVAGRPLANLSFALNYAFGKTSVQGYHAVNLLFHALAALTLFGIVRRTLEGIQGRSGEPGLANAALPVAAVAAGIWAVHPVLTGSVTYISQRTEVMMGLFYLLTLYGFIRTGEKSSRWWSLLSLLACLAGMLSKETMVTAPLLVFLYDATFVAGSIQGAAHRWRYYGGLAATWLILVVLMNGLQHRAVGFGLGVTWWTYAFTECQAILTYLRLVAWPHPLIFDYGDLFVERASVALVLGGSIALLLAGTWALYRRRPRIGFAALAFFLILAPTSSVVPVVAQPIAENRLYLPSAAIVVGITAGLFRVLGTRSLLVLTASALALATNAAQRNEVYRSRLSLAADTAAKRPTNPRALEMLGEVLYETGRVAEARAQFDAALRLNPAYPEAHNNLGTALRALGDRAEATRQFEQSIALKPDYAIAHNNLGNILTESGRFAEAQQHLEEALRLYSDEDRLKPDLAETHNNMGNVLLYQGRLEQAREHYKEAVRLKPDFEQAHMNLGVTLRETGQTEAALNELREALRLRPQFPEAQFNAGVAFQQLGRLAEARRCYEEALKRAPQIYQAHRNLAEVLAQLGDLRMAIPHYEEALRLRPDDAGARENLERVRQSLAGKPLP